MATRPERESRPAANRAANVSAGDLDANILPPTSDKNAIIGRRYWSRRIIDKAGGVSLPTFGSPQWLALPDGDPVKVAAVVIAAECWAQAGDTLEDDLRREVEDLRRAYLADEDEDYRRRAAAHRARWSGTPQRSFNARRAEQLRAAEPRPSDRPSQSGSAS